MKLLDYDRTTGLLFWKKSGKGRRKNLLAGTIDRRENRKSSRLNYIKININRTRTYAHRVVWIMHNGDIPKGLEVDHIDGDGLNNRIENLRLVTKTENMRSNRVRANSTTGIPGVRETTNGTYQARIVANNRDYFLGTFKTIIEAAEARKNGEKKYWGQNE